MAISLDPDTRRFTVPEGDLTLVGGTLYSLDTDAFRKEVTSLLSSEPYIWMPDAYIHNTEVTVAGTTFARTIEFINGYSVEFDDAGGAYSVRLEGSNNNIFDIQNGILVQNLIQVIPTNSAGLIRGDEPTSPAAVATAVWAADPATNTDADTMGGLIVGLLQGIDTNVNLLVAGAGDGEGVVCGITPQVLPTVYVGHKGDTYAFPVYRDEVLLAPAELAGATGLQVTWENEDTAQTVIVTVGVAPDESTVTYTVTTGDLILETAGKWVGQASGTTVGGEPFKSQQIRQLVELPVT